MSNAELIVDETSFFKLFNAASLEKHYREIPGTERLLSEHEIVACIKPTRVEWKLRIRLWDLVHKALDQTNDYDKIYTVDIVEGICGTELFYRKLSSKQYFASFLFSPIEKFTDEVDTMLSITRDKMWELINKLQPVKKDGTVDKTQAGMLIKIHQQLVDRKMGAVRQLVEMKKIQLNVNTDLPLDDIEVLDDKIRELRPKVDIIQARDTSPQITEGQE